MREEDWPTLSSGFFIHSFFLTATSYPFGGRNFGLFSETKEKWAIPRALMERRTFDHVCFALIIDATRNEKNLLLRPECFSRDRSSSTLRSFWQNAGIIYISLTSTFMHLFYLLLIYLCSAFTFKKLLLIQLLRLLPICN